MINVENDKSKLRNKYIFIRNNIENKFIKSKIIFNKLIEDELFKKSKIIALYKSLKSEVNTNEIIEYALNDGKIVVLPKVVDNNLEFYQIKSIDEKLEKSQFGVEEPIPNKVNYVSKFQIDLAIVPGICFDMEKNRIGFGKGYYDRILTDSYKIGICFSDQLCESIETENHDIKMDMIITENEIIL